MLKAPTLLAALASAAIIAFLALIFGPGGAGIPTAHAVPGVVTLLAIDVDIDDDGDTNPDNNDSVVGTVNACVELALNDTIDIDLVVRGVDPVDKIAGYQVDIEYDPTVISVLNVIDVDSRGSVAPNNVTMISRINSTGGTSFLSLTDISANPNAITVAAADGTADAFFHVAGVQGPPAMHEPGDTTNAIDDDFDGTTDEADEASQDGVLARITVQAVGAGQSDLLIPGPSGGADGFPDQKVSDGYGENATLGDPIPITDVDFAAISVGQACVPPEAEPNVQIAVLDCNSDPEVVTITNMGSATQDLTGWTLTSETGDIPVFDLSIIGFGTANEGVLLAGDSVKVYSDSQAPSELNVALGDYPWDTNEKFRDFDTSDFAQIRDNTSAVIDAVNCSAATPTPTPTPQVTRTATPTPTPQGGVTQVPPTGDGIPTGDGSKLGWPLVAVGVTIALAAIGYVLYGRSRRRPTD